MENVIRALNEVILARKGAAEEGSYTAYLFREGLDKILKKCGEECAEVIIAAKSLEAARSAGVACGEKTAGHVFGSRDGDGAVLAAAEDGGTDADRMLVQSEDALAGDLENEICDLLYHLLVLMADLGIPLADIEEILRQRAEKTGNLKQMKTVDKDS